MSFIIENRPSNEINNKDREHFLSLEMKEDYSFKYIPESHFKHIVKNVQRQRRKENEERIWASFVKEQELNSLSFHKQDTDHSIQSTKDLFQDNIQDVDRELKRLQEDAMPEGSKGIHRHRGPRLKSERNYMQIDSGRNNSSMEKLLTMNRGTYSTTVLAPVSRANNVSTHKEPDGLKTVFRSKVKKSLSDSSVTEKKCYTNQLLRVTNWFDDDSDTDSNNFKEDTVYIQPDPVTVQKLLSMQEKIGNLLDEISLRLCRIPLPDGENDLKRRQQQSLEFAIRFSRNYLYNLNRLVTSIQRHMRTVTARAGLKQYSKNIAFHQDMIKQKLIGAHQLLVQALNAYYKHIPNSILKGHSTKLQDVLQIVCKLKDICDKVEISTNYFCSGDTTVTPPGKHLRDKCEALLSKLKYNSESKYGFTDWKNVEAAIPVAPASLHNKKHNRKNLSSRLSMYSMDVEVSRGNQKKRNDLRRKSTRQKGTNSNVGDLRNMNSQHNSLPELLYPSPITRTSSSRDVVQIDSLNSRNYLKEDDIRTMMDGVTIDSENDNNVENRAKCNNLSNATMRKDVASEVLKSKNAKERGASAKEGSSTFKEEDAVKKVATIAKDHVATLAPVINDLVSVLSKKPTNLEGLPISEVSMEILRKYLEKYHPPEDNDAKKLSANDKCQRWRSKLNGHGENVQLICMSSMEMASKPAQCDASCQADYKISHESASGSKTMRSNVNGGLELNISKESTSQFLAFRHEYINLCQSRPMYSSNTQNKPWDIVSWISDKLIDELIIEITEELQMSDIIKKLFEMEFKEF